MTSENIDIGKLERELVTALEADKKYSRENDAKLRAVQQKVQTYEEFRCVCIMRLQHKINVCTNNFALYCREIVQASHLVPLDRQDLTCSSARKQPWNMAAHGSIGISTAVPDVLQTSDHIRNVQEFTREWRRLKKRTPEEQYQ